MQQSENDEHVQGAAVQETVLRIMSLDPRKLQVDSCKD